MGLLRLSAGGGTDKRVANRYSGVRLLTGFAESQLAWRQDATRTPANLLVAVRCSASQDTTVTDQDRLRSLALTGSGWYARHAIRSSNKYNTVLPRPVSPVGTITRVRQRRYRQTRGKSLIWVRLLTRFAESQLAWRQDATRTPAKCKTPLYKSGVCDSTE